MSFILQFKYDSVSDCFHHVALLTPHIQSVFIDAIDAEEPNHQKTSYQESPPPPPPPPPLDHQLPL